MNNQKNYFSFIWIEFVDFFPIHANFFKIILEFFYITSEVTIFVYAFVAKFHITLKKFSDD